MAFGGFQVACDCSGFMDCRFLGLGCRLAFWTLGSVGPDQGLVTTTVDDINPALPIIRNIP